VGVRITKPEELERARPQLATLQQPLETGMLGSGVQANLLDLAQNDQQFSLTFSQAGIDAKSTRVDASVMTLKTRIPLVTVTGGLPVSLAELRSDPRAAQTAPLAITATIPTVPAKALPAAPPCAKGKSCGFSRGSTLRAIRSLCSFPPQNGPHAAPRGGFPDSSRQAGMLM